MTVLAPLATTTIFVLDAPSLFRRDGFGRGALMKMLLVEQGYDVHRLMPDGLCFGHAVLAECVERHLLPSCRAALAAIDAGHACLALDRHMTAFNPARLDGLDPGCRAMLAPVQVQITATEVLDAAAAVERAAAGRTFLDP